MRSTLTDSDGSDVIDPLLLAQFGFDTPSPTLAPFCCIYLAIGISAMFVVHDGLLLSRFVS
jgi:hypothetical protein